METQTNEGALPDSRRYRLAFRLMTHQARTQTISAMTSLSRHQQETLRRRWRITEETRRRGPSPTSLDRFTHSPRARAEGASLAAICRIYGLIPLEDIVGAPRRKLLTLELGERLCDTYETYRACFSRSELEFEQLLSFVLGVAENEVIGLGRCISCSGTVLIDRLAPLRPTCAHCQRAGAESLVVIPEADSGDDPPLSKA
jgi:hypothetical protein